MSRFVAGILTAVFILATLSPAYAQLIDWNRRNRNEGAAVTAPAPAPAPVRRTPSQYSAPRMIEVQGTIIALDERRNQVTIRDAEDGRRKEFVVDERTMRQLSRYDQVVITIEEGSRQATSVRVVR